MAGKIRQKSEKVRKDWIQLDALSCGTGWDEGDLEKPQILIEDVFGSMQSEQMRRSGYAKILWQF